MELFHLAGVERLEQRQEQVLFVLEVRVDGTLRKAGRSGDLVERRAVEAPLRKHLGGRLEQVVAGLAAPFLRGEGLECHGRRHILTGSYW